MLKGLFVVYLKVRFNRASVSWLRGVELLDGPHGPCLGRISSPGGWSKPVALMGHESCEDVTFRG